METLNGIMDRRKWYDLRATAGAYNLPFDGTKPKREIALRLSKSLSEDGYTRRQFRQLATTEREPLIALQAAGGQMPRDQFIAAFGQVRPYRPWRYDSPRQPWKQPISAAEKLWFLAFVDFKEDTVIAPNEVLAMLPPLPKVHLKAAVTTQAVPTAALLLVDLAVLLGSLLYEDVKPRWSRWLPPYLMKRVNAAFRVPGCMTHVRSELQTGRLGFLHYLAEAAGLVSLQMGYLKPTPVAWGWLDSAPEQQWQLLWESIQRDLERREPLWNRYRLPPITARIWGELAALLQSLELKQGYDLISLIGALRPRLPAESLASIPNLLEGALSWLGAVSMSGSDAFQFYGLPPVLPTPEITTLQILQGNGQNQAIALHLPIFPHLRPLVEIMAWAALDGATLSINAEAVRRAQQDHQCAVQIANSLVQLIGGPVPRESLTLLNQWERLVRRLTLQHRVTLTSPDSDLLASLMADRYLRPMFEQPLSAHHLVVRPHCVDQLVQALERRDLPTVDQRRENRLSEGNLDHLDDHLDSQTAAYLWLAVRAYQGLNKFASMPVYIPGALLERLEVWLAEGQQDWLNQTADALLSNLARAVANEASMLLTAPVQQDDPANIRAAIERAFADRSAVTIDYFSPAQGMITRRTIEPILPIVQRGDFAYIEAWCSEAEDERTFRLDRIVRLAPLGA
jgi:hypothetical protein